MSYPKTSKNILLLGFVSLLNDISSEIIQPILPIFITSLGGGSLALGLIGGVSDGLPSILQVFSGYWSDRLGKRKPLVVAGYGLSALGKLFLPISSTWQQVFVLKTLERTGKGVRTAPRDALISESTDKSLRGRGFGLHRAMDSAGAVVGSILAYLLWQIGLSFSSIFIVAAVLASSCPYSLQTGPGAEKVPQLPGSDQSFPIFRRTCENSWSLPPFSLWATSATCSSSCAPKLFSVARRLWPHLCFYTFCSILYMPVYPCPWGSGRIESGGRKF